MRTRAKTPSHTRMDIQLGSKLRVPERTPRFKDPDRRHMELSYEELEEKRSIAEIFTLIGENLMEKGKIEDAQAYFYQSLEVSTAMGARKEILNNFKFLSLSYASLQNFDSASKYITEYTSLNDSISATKTSRRTAADLKEPVLKPVNHLMNYRWALIIAGILIVLLISIIILRKNRFK